MSKKSMKGFIKDHWKGIAIGAGSVIVGGILGIKYSQYVSDKAGAVVVDKNIKNLLFDAQRVYNGNVTNVYWEAFDEPLAAADLGKLGESILSYPISKDTDTFTHFIAIGKANS